jgi:hypothetical protein
MRTGRSPYREVDVKRQKVLPFMILLSISALAAIDIAGAADADPPIGQSPANAAKAVVVEKEFNFNEILDGEIVTHAYLEEIPFGLTY